MELKSKNGMCSPVSLSGGRRTKKVPNEPTNTASKTANEREIPKHKAAACAGNCVARNEARTVIFMADEYKKRGQFAFCYDLQVVNRNRRM